MKVKKVLYGLVIIGLIFLSAAGYRHYREAVTTREAACNNANMSFSIMLKHHSSLVVAYNAGRDFAEQYQNLADACERLTLDIQTATAQTDLAERYAASIGFLTEFCTRVTEYAADDFDGELHNELNILLLDSFESSAFAETLSNLEHELQTSGFNWPAGA